MSFTRIHDRFLTDVGVRSRTRQAHAAECDITNILRQYQRTGIISHIAARQPFFDDLPSHYDLQDSLAIVARAEEAFAQLPAVVRDEFRNDPHAFLAAFSDPSKNARLRELGLLTPLRPADAVPSEAEAPKA